MKAHFLPILFACLASTAFAQNQRPNITNLAASVNWTTNTLTLTYDVADAENDPLEISFAISNNGGKTYTPASILLLPTGDVGFPVAPGTGKSISCDVSSFAGLSGLFTVRLLADDRQPVDIQSLVNQVDSTRLRNDLSFVEGIRHRTTGAAHLQATRDSLQSLFAGLGLFTDIQSFNYANTMGRNIIGTSPGTGVAERVVVVDAHYDTVQNAPGADDNGSGTVGVMEIARILAGWPSKKSLRFIGFDLEEAGLVGSQRYVQSGIPAGETIEGVFNFEMIGYYTEMPNTQELPAGFNLLFPDAYNAVAADDFRGNFITNVGNAASQSLIDLFKNAAAQYVPGLKVVSVAVPGNGQIASDLRRSDHAPFWDTGRKALMLTDGADFRNECYHTPADTASEKLNFTFMSNVVKATLAAAAQLAEIQHAGWATTTFEKTSAAHEPTPCQWQAWTDGDFPAQLFVTAGQCPSEAAHLELLDEKGSHIFSQTVHLQENAVETLLLPRALPTGLYILKLSQRDGVSAQKLFIR
ncbi:MAG: M28 family peptidase [Saprospiraceae bacterium]